MTGFLVRSAATCNSQQLVDMGRPTHLDPESANHWAASLVVLVNVLSFETDLPFSTCTKRLLQRRAFKVRAGHWQHRQTLHTKQQLIII